jgi:hypothetical protein
MVHGSEAPYVYLGWKNLKTDPNLVCECLNRTLQAEEILRGVLPDTLYVQTDNCIRENKNTYTEKFMEWLVECGVVKAIYTSFLPLGHTHFDCDQLASCISEAIKNKDITSIAQLTKLIEECFTPNPHIVFLNDVMDWRKLINPDDKPDFSVSSARCRRARGIATKLPPKPPPSTQEEFMVEQ